MLLCCGLTLTATVQLALLSMCLLPGWMMQLLVVAVLSVPLCLYFRMLRVSWQQGLLIQVGMSQLVANMKCLGKSFLFVFPRLLFGCLFLQELLIIHSS